MNEQSKPFITSWEIKSRRKYIEIPANYKEFKYSYTVDWGDGSVDNRVYTGIPSHKYANPGVYQVKIYGIFPHIYFYNAPQYIRDKIISVDQWGDQVWKSMRMAFYSCKNLKILAKDSPNLSSVTNMSYMFYNAKSFNQVISDWDVSSVTNMNSIFEGSSSFNQNLGSWDVSSVTTMNGMFYNDTSFNRDISSWDVSSVTNMGGMFAYATSFNQVISDWDVSSVKDRSYMFINAISFNNDINFLLKLFKKRSKRNLVYSTDLVKNISMDTQNYKKMFRYIKKYNIGKPNIILKTVNNHE